MITSDIRIKVTSKWEKYIAVELCWKN